MIHKEQSAMNRKKRARITFFVLLFLLMGFPLFGIFKAIDHHRKNQALIVAVKALDYPKIRTLLTLLEHVASVSAKGAIGESALLLCEVRKIESKAEAIKSREEAITVRVDIMNSSASPMDRHKQQALDMAQKMADKSYADACKSYASACKIEALLSKYGAK